MKSLVAIALGATVVLTGCTSDPEPTRSTSSPPTASAATSVSPTPIASDTPPSASPDPSTAGGLSAATLPAEFLGFTPDKREPEEDEFIPNGTWVFAAKDPTSAADQTWTGCGTEVPDHPAHVLMGLYANQEGSPGIGQAFEFEDDLSAKNWFDAYASDVAQCMALGKDALRQVIETNAAADVMVDRRMMAGEPWSERVWLSDRTVLFVIIQDDSSLQELLDAVT